MTERNAKKEGAYAQLTGFRRAVPIILVALAVFTGLCFIMSDTGTLGQAISRLLLGLFSIGGYFIPFFLAVHAVFYASDIQKKRIVGRIIFTVLTVFTISALTHTITFYSDAEMVFDVKKFYNDGTEAKGGGFIGGILAFSITHLFGNIGLILIAIVMLALYVTYFLSSGRSVFPRFLSRIGGAISELFASSRERKETSKQKRAAKKEERRIESLRADQEELSDDEFFGVESGMKEISIPALDIREVRSDADLEANPHLQEKVFPRAEAREEAFESRFDYGESYAASSDRPRTVNMEYSTTESEHTLSVSVEDSVFRSKDDDIIVEHREEPVRETSRRTESTRTASKEASADDIFASGAFEAYDVKINEELSNRPSSKAARVEKEPAGISKIETSISDITPEEVERARQRADFEMKKRASIEAQKRYAEAQAEIARAKAREANEAERMRAAAEPESVVFTYGTPDPSRDGYDRAPEKAEREAYIPDYMRTEASAEKAESTAEATMTEPDARPSAESGERRAYTAPEDDTRRAAFASAISDYERDRTEESFKPYTAPTVASEPDQKRDEMRVTRSMLEPTARPIESESYYRPTTEADTRTAYAAESAREAVYSEPVRDSSYTAPETSAPYSDTRAETAPRYSEPVRDSSYTAPETSAPYSDTRAETAPRYSEPARDTSYAAPETSAPYSESRAETAPRYSEPARDTAYAAPETSATYSNSSAETAPRYSEPARDTSYAAPETSAPYFDTRAETAPRCSEPARDTAYAAPETSAPYSDADEDNVHTIIPEVETSSETDEPEVYEFASEESAVVFDDGDEEDAEENEVVTEPEDEDQSGGYEEIPPELQNKDVIEQRNMFSFLRDERSEEDDDETDFPERPEASPAEPEDKAPWDTDAEDESEEDEEETPAPPQRSAFAERMAAMERQKAPEPAPEPEPEPEPEKPDYSDYVFPSVELLKKGKFEEDVNQEEEKNANAEKLVDALQQFNVRISIKAVDRGPRITRYEIVPARGVKVNSVTSLFNDIQLSLGVEGMRMEAPIPGKSAIGVEIPNKKPSTVLLRDLVETAEFTSAPSKTMSCLGKDVTGNPVFADIAKMPHILIAGATGMGKSVCINAILLSILYKAKPDEVKLIMIDPKKVEFARYNGIPHLLVPVVTDVKQAAGALMWAVEQMEKRYDLLQQLEVSKLDSYNEKVRENPSLGEPLPKIIIVIDELNDIMLQVRKPAEDLIMSIAQKARAAGIHLIIGTQRPSVDVITGVIKANIPSRISCKVASYNDSKTILEQAGAEKLLNNGDMLYIPAGAPKALRVQGAFCSDDEVSAVAKHLKSQVKGNIYDERALEEINKAAQKCQKGKGGGDEIEDDEDTGEDGIGLFNDQQFLDAVDVALRSGKISTSLLQRKLRIGYSKAAMFIDNMEDLGIVGEPCGSKPRDVLITKDEWHEVLARRSLD